MILSNIQENDEVVGNSNSSDLGQMSKEMQQLQAILAEISRRFNDKSTGRVNVPVLCQEQTNADLLNTEILPFTTRRRPVDELAPVNIVPAKVKRDILAHKHVNLALLLIPGMECVNETQMYDQNGQHVIVRANNNRLHKPLSIHDFRTALRNL